MIRSIIAFIPIVLILVGSFVSAYDAASEIAAACDPECPQAISIAGITLDPMKEARESAQKKADVSNQMLLLLIPFGMVFFYLYRKDLK